MAAFGASDRQRFKGEMNLSALLTEEEDACSKPEHYNHPLNYAGQFRYRSLGSALN